MSLFSPLFLIFPRPNIPRIGYSLLNQGLRYKIASDLSRLNAVFFWRKEPCQPQGPFKMQTNFGRFTQISIAAAVLLGAAGSLHAQNFPVTADQKATASQVAQAGVAIEDLAPNAPDNYTVKKGDTLWAISGMFLKGPWRWPELWGMNMQDISNPHRIYPGQQLYLDKSSGRAILRTGMRAQNNGGPPTDTIRVSPRARTESLADAAIPTLAANIIEPFLSEALIIDEAVMLAAPRIVAAQENRVLLSRGDRAYVRGRNGANGQPLSVERGQPLDYRVFRNTTALKDPDTGAVLGYEAAFLGKAELLQGESTSQIMKDGKTVTEVTPGTIDIVMTKEEMRIGDRLVPEPPRELVSYVPRAPAGKIEARVMSIYGSAVRYASANQVVTINRGSRDGIERGHVMAILKDGESVIDKTDARRTPIKLPNERNGLMMVFRVYEKLSYGLVLQVTDGVKVGDRLVNPN
jgi:hypothetical protein